MDKTKKQTYIKKIAEHIIGVFGEAHVTEEAATFAARAAVNTIETWEAGFDDGYYGGMPSAE